VDSVYSDNVIVDEVEEGKFDTHPHPGSRARTNNHGGIASFTDGGEDSRSAGQGNTVAESGGGIRKRPSRLFIEVEAEADADADADRIPMTDVAPNTTTAAATAAVDPAAAPSGTQVHRRPSNSSTHSRSSDAGDKPVTRAVGRSGSASALLWEAVNDAATLQAKVKRRTNRVTRNPT
jgi:hypothetical protein